MAILVSSQVAAHQDRFRHDATTGDRRKASSTVLTSGRSLRSRPPQLVRRRRSGAAVHCDLCSYRVWQVVVYPALFKYPSIWQQILEGQGLIGARPHGQRVPVNDNIYRIFLKGAAK